MEELHEYLKETHTKWKYKSTKHLIVYQKHIQWERHQNIEYLSVWFKHLQTCKIWNTMCLLLIKVKIIREVLGDLDHMTDIYLVCQMSKSVRLLWWAVASHGNFDLGYVTIEVVWVNVKQQHQLTQVEGGYIEGSLHSNSTDLPHLLSKWSTSTQHHMPKQARLLDRVKGEKLRIQGDCCYEYNRLFCLLLH